MNRTNSNWYRRFHGFNVFFSLFLILGNVLYIILIGDSTRGLLTSTPIIVVLPAFLISVTSKFDSVKRYKPALSINVLTGYLVFLYAWNIEYGGLSHSLQQDNFIAEMTLVALSLVIYPLFYIFLLLFHTRVDGIEKGGLLSIGIIPLVYAMVLFIKSVSYPWSKGEQMFVPMKILLALGAWLIAVAIGTLIRRLLLWKEYKVKKG